MDCPNESTHFNFPPPDPSSTPENSTHIYFKDIILPASDEVCAPNLDLLNLPPTHGRGARRLESATSKARMSGPKSYWGPLQ